MIKYLAAIGAAFFLTAPVLSQSADAGPGAGDCDQVRQAVATYGYAAARRYALQHYGPQAAAYGDRCLAGKHQYNYKYSHQYNHRYKYKYKYGYNYYR
jgi:hypothetical protein